MRAVHYLTRWTHKTSFTKSGPNGMLLQQAANHVKLFKNLQAKEASTCPNVMEHESIKSQPKKDDYLDAQNRVDHHPYPLSKEEAFSFLENVLRIESPQRAYQANPLMTMNMIADRIKRTIPFTTMVMFDRPLDQINETGKDHILRCHGGGCISVNPFTQSLLDHLGYRTQDILASIPGMNYDSHIATIVWDVSYPGSRHLVDPGLRRPLLQAISLDFEGESDIYRSHYARYKFFKEGDDNFLWSIQPTSFQKLAKEESITDKSGQKWKVLLNYNLRKPMARYHINKHWKMLLEGTLEFPPGVEGLVFCAFKSDHMIEINATREKIVVRVFDEDAQVAKTEMSSEDLIKFFMTNFPNYPVQMLLNAIKAGYDWSPRGMDDECVMNEECVAG